MPGILTVIAMGESDMSSNVPLPPLPSQSPEAALQLDDVLSRSFPASAGARGGVEDAVVADAVRQVSPGRWADRVELLLVDNQGLDRRELFGRDLIEALAEGEAEVIDHGDNGDYFDQVVRTLEGERRHKAG